MTRETAQPILTVVLVDYDNIYLALRKRSEEAAKRFAKDAVYWVRLIESGRLLSATNSAAVDQPRRIVVNRCYGNPVPRRNPQDNSTDMTSFPFVRHHFLRAGFEVVDCPPLTAQLKNSSDIKMVMDANDMISHDTRFDEFIILSGDADFTPLLHRIRAHNRRSVIFANDFTAAAYKAICDAEIKESSLMAALLEPAAVTDASPQQIAAPVAVQPLVARPEPPQALPQPAPVEINFDRLRAEIVASVVIAVKGAGGPVPLEALAERTTRALGHDRTIGTQWAGSGGFLELLRRHLPAEITLTAQPPYLAFEVSRMLAPPAQQSLPIPERRQPEPVLQAPVQRTPMQAPTPVAPPMPAPRFEQAPVPMRHQPVAPQHMPAAPAVQPVQRDVAPRPSPAIAPTIQQAVSQQPVAQQPVQAQNRGQTDMAAAIQASIARIHEACQAPPLSPPDYRALFDAIAKEISEQGLQGGQTLSNIHTRTQSLGLSVGRDDIRFVMEVVSEADPWFEQGVSAVLFAGRFRNFVVARCRGQGLQLSSDELDLIDAWFAGGQPVAPQSIRGPAPAAAYAPQVQTAQPSNGEQRLPGEANVAGEPSEEFPKILRTRLRG